MTLVCYLSIKHVEFNFKSIANEFHQLIHYKFLLWLQLNLYIVQGSAVKRKDL